ncbi:hypothetical protein [Microbacterium sp. KRD174]
MSTAQYVGLARTFASVLGVIALSMFFAHYDTWTGAVMGSTLQVYLLAMSTRIFCLTRSFRGPDLTR